MSSAALSPVPNRAIAVSFAHDGARSMSSEPTTNTGLAIGATIAAASSAAPRPSATEAMPARPEAATVDAPRAHARSLRPDAMGMLRSRAACRWPTGCSRPNEVCADGHRRGRCSHADSRLGGRSVMAASPRRRTGHHMTTTTASGTLTDGERDAAIEHFAAKLRYETDPTDVAAAVAAGDALRPRRHPRPLVVAPGPRARRRAHPARRDRGARGGRDPDRHARSSSTAGARRATGRPARRSSS